MIPTLLQNLERRGLSPCIAQRVAPNTRIASLGSILQLIIRSKGHGHIRTVATLPVTRESSEWPRRVRAAAERKLREGSHGDWPTRTVATWLDGPWLHIVYQREGFDVYYGCAWDTRKGITGSDWPDPESIGFEIAAYGVFEPHGSSEPPMFGPPTKIHWIGELPKSPVVDIADIAPESLWERPP